MKFIRPAIVENNIRLASLEDIAAFKLEAICSRKEKKDYVDIAVLLTIFSFKEMIDFYCEKYLYADKRVLLSQILDITELGKSKDLVMLIDLNDNQAVKKIEDNVSQFTRELIERQMMIDNEREEK